MDEAQKARLQAVEIAVQTIAGHLRSMSEGFDAVAAGAVFNEAAHIQKMSTDDGKTYATSTVEHLKELLHVP